MSAFRRFALVAAAVLALSVPAHAETASSETRTMPSAVAEDVAESADVSATVAPAKSDDDDVGIAPDTSPRRIKKKAGPTTKS